MESPADLFGGLPPQLCVFGSYPSPAAPPSGARPPPGPARPPYPLIHHLLQPADSAPRRAGGVLPPDGFLGQGEEDGGGWDEEEERREGGGPGGQVRGKRRGGAALVASWRREVMTVKRLRLGRGGEEEEGEEEERGRRERGREGRRREREELKEQLEEARGRLQALQERVWKAFGETRPPEEERRKRRGGGEEEEEEGEDMAERIYEEEEEEEEEGGGADELSLSLVPSPPLQGSRREERRGDGGERMERGGGGGEGGGGLFLKSVLERAGLWMGCGLVRGEWEGEGGGGEGEEGGQKFAQALKLELGDAVTRVIDRVLRLYTHSHTHTLSPSPPSPPPDMHSLRGERGSEGGGGVWTGRREGGEKGERGETDHTLGPSHALHLPHPNQSRREQSEALPLVTRRLPPPSHSDRPHLLPPHPSLPRLPPPRHPHPLLPPRSKESFLSHSYPPGPPPLPLPLPLLHYTMQQLFGRSLPPLPPLQKDLLTSDPYLDFPSSSYPPLPLLAHLDPALPHLHPDREREGGMRGGGGGEGGEMYLAGGASQDGLSPCHLKKAKLMFFYARYPSSNTLKTYFPDVKFNRCVTSQLIKWFSNFREFFYIQMERFARQAVRDRVPREGAPGLGREGREGPGLARDPQVRLGRDTELYRILNMHYNKSNDYQVPDRFVEVAEIALREFFTAILSGRDSDPCWKKSIYKIICKLDGPVPDSFKLPGCPLA